MWTPEFGSGSWISKTLINIPKSNAFLCFCSIGMAGGWHTKSLQLGSKPQPLTISDRTPYSSVSWEHKLKKPRRKRLE